MAVLCRVVACLHLPIWCKTTRGVTVLLLFTSQLLTTHANFLPRRTFSYERAKPVTECSEDPLVLRDIAIIPRDRLGFYTTRTSYLFIGTTSPLLELTLHYRDSWFGKDQQIPNCQKAVRDAGYVYLNYTSVHHSIWGGLLQDEYILHCHGIKLPSTHMQEWALVTETTTSGLNGLNYVSANGKILEGMVMKYAPIFSEGKLHNVQQVQHKLFWTPYQLFIIPDLMILSPIGGEKAILSLEHSPQYGINLVEVFASNYEYIADYGNVSSPGYIFHCFGQTMLKVALDQETITIYWLPMQSEFYGVLDYYLDDLTVGYPFYIQFIVDTLSWLADSFFTVILPILGRLVMRLPAVTNIGMLISIALAVVLNKYIGYFPLSGLISAVCYFYMTQRI